MHSLLADLRFAIRQFLKSPGFTLTAVLTLAIGIGGVTAVFSIMNAVIFEPLRFPDSSRLVSLHTKAEHDSHDLSMSAPDVIEFEREARAFSGAAGFVGSGYEVAGAGAPFRAQAERVTSSLFSVIQAQPVIGRTFTKQEEESGAPVAVISYPMWKERFGGAPNVLGRSIDLDRRPYTVIGVMPRDFEFPVDAGRLSGRDLWVPMSFSPVEKQSEGDNYDYSLVARLKPGVTPQQAQTDVDRIANGISSRMPKSAGTMRMFFVPLRDEAVRNARPVLRALLGAVALLLVMACANLANLLLVKTAGRRRELGMRLALGAARARICRQILTESVLLSVMGGLAGTLLAIVLVESAAAKLPESLPRLGEIHVNWPLLLAAVVLTFVTGVVCGLAPAVQSMREDVLESLREGGRGAGSGVRHAYLRNAIVIGEVGVAVVLLMASGLLLRSFAKMLAVDPGFQPAHVITAPVALPAKDYPDQQNADAFFTRLSHHLQAEPGVQAVGFGSNIPLVGQNSGRLIAPEGYVRGKDEGWNIVSNYLVAGRYFEAMRIPLLRGRFFTPTDEDPNAPLVTVIGESLARKYFAGKDALGMRIKVGPDFATNMPAMKIVGIVGDIKQGARDEATVPQMYEPVAQAQQDLGPYAAMIGVVGSLDVVVRTSGDAGAMARALTSAVHDLDPMLAVQRVHTMDEIVASTEHSRRFNTWALTSFAGIALILSLIGIYGVIAYSVTERTREIAIRMALGETRQRILARTLKYAFGLTAVGAALGVIASVGLTRVVESLLFGVKPVDGVAIAGAVTVLFACAGLAALLPARRAAGVDPIEALRE